MKNHLIARLRKIGSSLRLERDWYLVVMAMVIGIVIGSVAVAFISPLRAIEEWSEGADRSLMRWLVPIVPVFGALAAGLVIYLMHGYGKGPGVSAVIYSVHRERSKLPFYIAIRKWIASTLTIGSGGSAGAEGPIVTIGSVIGSNIAQLLKMNPQSTATMLGCGAAAGISAVFNAPLAGIFFVLEIMLRDFSLRTFTPIVIASVVSAAWAQQMLGNDPIFNVGSDYFGASDLFTVTQIPNVLMLGLICGIAAPTFVRGLFLSESLFGRLRVHPILKPACGAALLGVLGLLFMVIRPEEAVPEFYGNGYPIIKKLLMPSTYAEAEVSLVLLLCSIAILKGVATCLTIGSGGAGGLFAPSLLMGASVGGAFGFLVNHFNWFPASSPASYALVGMGAMVAAATHAPLTGILIVYEITGKTHQTILPLMVAAVIATIVSRLMNRESVYTVKLAKMGVRLGAMSDLTILRRLAVSDVALLDPVFVHQDESAQRLLELSEQHTVTDFIVIDDDKRYVGLVTGLDLKEALVYREAIPLLQVNELLRVDLPTVTRNDTLDVVLDKFSHHDVHSLAVLQDEHSGKAVGLITRPRLMSRYQVALDED